MAGQLSVSHTCVKGNHQAVNCAGSLIILLILKEVKLVSLCQIGQLSVSHTCVKGNHQAVNCTGSLIILLILKEIKLVFLCVRLDTVYFDENWKKKIIFTVYYCLALFIGLKSLFTVHNTLVKKKSA